MKSYLSFRLKFNSKYLFILSLIFFSCSSDKLAVQKLYLDYSLSNYAKILGKVIDMKNGQIIDGATLLLSNTNNNSFYEAITDSEGKFTFPNVLSGSYNLNVKSIYYESEYLNNIQLDENYLYQINLELKTQEINWPQL